MGTTRVSGGGGGGPLRSIVCSVQFAVCTLPRPLVVARAPDQQNPVHFVPSDDRQVCHIGVGEANPKTRPRLPRTADCTRPQLVLLWINLHLAARPPSCRRL